MRVSQIDKDNGAPTWQRPTLLVYPVLQFFYHLVRRQLRPLEREQTSRVSSSVTETEVPDNRDLSRQLECGVVSETA